MRFTVFATALLLSQMSHAETVPVKYHHSVSLDAFECTNVSDTSDVTRICYDAPEQYMLIQLKNTYYQYCEIDATTVAGLKNARSKRQYFDSRIRGSGLDGPFDCRIHVIPRKYR